MSTNIYPFKDHMSWLEGLNVAPPKGKISERSLGGSKKSKYVPLPVQEALADVFFRECDIVDVKYQLALNEILCTVKLSILPNYPHAEHRTITGSASKPVQCKKGSKIENFPMGKISNAMEYNLPAVQSAAKSNALTNFANIFGRNLNREAPNDFNFLSIIKEKSNAKD